MALRRRGGERGGVLRRAGHLDPDDVVGALADQPGAVEHLAELGAQVGIGACRAPARPSRRPPPARGRGRRGRRSRGRGCARDTYSLGSAPIGCDEALGEQQHRGARADPVGERADDVRAAPRTAPPGRRGRTPASSISAGALDGDAVGQRRPRAGTRCSRACARSRRPSPRCGSRAGPRARRGRAARRPPSPSCRRRSPRPCAAAAARRATPTAARCSARSGRSRSRRAPATDARCAGTSVGLPTRSFTFRGRIRQPRRTCSVPCTATGSTAAPGLERQTADAALRASRASPIGSGSPRGRCTPCRPARGPAGRSPSRSRRTGRGGSGTRRAGRGPSPASGFSNSSTLATNCIGRRHGSRAPITNGSRKLRWFEATIRPPLMRACSRPVRWRRSQIRNAGHEDRPSDVVEDPVDAVLARVGVVALEALLADHLVVARRRRAAAGPRPCDVPTRASRPALLLGRPRARRQRAAAEAARWRVWGGLRHNLACVEPHPDRRDRPRYQAASSSARISRAPGSRASLQLRAGEDRVDAPLEPRDRRRARDRRRGPPPSSSTRSPSSAPLDAERRGERRHLRPGSASAAPPASAAASSRWSRRAGSRSSRTSVWQTTWWRRTAPSRARRRRGSSRARARGIALGARVSSALGDQLGAAQRGQLATGLASGV